MAAALNAKSQTTLDKLNTGVYQAGQVQSTMSKIKSFFPKKKSKAPVTGQAAIDSLKPGVTPIAAGTVVPVKKVTVITVKGIDFSKLKTFTENIHGCEGVDSANMKFNSEISIIRVIHSGTSEELLKLLEEKAEGIFTESNIESFEEGNITLRL